MARNESDREDLMAEAVSLVTRLECQLPGRPDVILAGFNQQGWLFVYFGADPMYRFDEQGRLRRAFVDGTLYRTSGNTLAAMRRQRSPESNPSAPTAESLLLRRDLSPDETEAFRQSLRGKIQDFVDGLSPAVITRQHPPGMAGIDQQIRHGLGRVLESEVFLAPAIVRR